MKATINNIQVEGTPKEIHTLIELYMPQNVGGTILKQGEYTQTDNPRIMMDDVHAIFDPSIFKCDNGCARCAGT